MKLFFNLDYLVELRHEDWKGDKVGDFDDRSIA
jgi:hypothetical protein